MTSLPRSLMTSLVISLPPSPMTSLPHSATIIPTAGHNHGHDWGSSAIEMALLRKPSA